MTQSSIQNSFSSGEISPSVFGRTDLGKFHNGAFTMRNFFANFRGGASSRAGLAYCGTCKQAASVNSNPPRLIPFQFNITQGYALEFGDQYMRILYQGAYITEASKTITGITQATPGVFTSATHGFSNNDWISISGIVGMTNFNGLTWIVQNSTTNTFTVTDLFGNAISTALYNAYVSGGTASRIYTVVSPYAAIDLPYLKYTQSADTMSLTCWNQLTLTEYPPYDLVRSGNTSWAFNLTVIGSQGTAPTGVTATATSSTTVNTWYSYVVTSIDSVTGQESVASSPAAIENNDISLFAGSNTIKWTAVAGASSYNVYTATPAYNVTVPIGVAYGFIGSAFAPNFVDSNIIADFATSPPTHQNPFARGQITSVKVTVGGTGYTQAGVTYSITTSTGSGFIGVPVIIGGALAGFVVENSGIGYAATDTISFTQSGASGATATLTVGPETGTYPACVAYFEQRRAYASTQNEPDTYFMSQPGNYTNFDSAIPVVDSDSITGAPWAQQINGIQFMVPMPSGLIVLTGKGAWLLNGYNGAAITPSSEQAQAQAYNGCSNIVPPIVINYDVLYVQSKGSIVRDLSYNFYANIYTGTDTTVLSNHLFNYYQIVQWSYAEEPYKLVWAVRNDGILLCLTYLKEQEISAWTRHDTNGFFVSTCSVIEPPVDAAYFIVKRYIAGKNQWAYYTERMDNRNWINAEDCFCVDAGLSYPMTFPAATLTAASATGSSNISSVNYVSGGTGYTAPTLSVVDSTGAGTGAVMTANLTGGVITSVTVSSQGTNYTPGFTTITVTDTTGSGARLQPVITNNVNFTASSGVFTSGMVGNVIRVGNNNSTVLQGIGTIGGGKAVITAYTSSTQVVANIVEPLTSTIPNDPNFTPIPAIAGEWSVSVPVSTVGGLNHLAGMEVAILADGSVVNNQVVSATGTVTLPAPASAIVVGLPYTCQLQTAYLDPAGQPTIQGKRKNIYNIILRVEGTRGLASSTNQPDSSTEPNFANVPWQRLIPIKDESNSITSGNAVPLLTDDIYLNVPGDWSEHGQVAIEQDFPLPANINAVVVNYQVGDTSDKG